MRRAFLSLACALPAFLGSTQLQARIMSVPSPQELDTKAALICTGEVLSDEAVEAPKEYSYSKINPTLHREQVRAAKIKILHIFKGAAPSEIELRYHVSASLIGECDGARHIRIEKGKRYRFFLNSTTTGPYIGVLDGQFDDGFAVQSLCLNESPDTPYLTKDEVLTIARDYLAAQRIITQPDWSKAYAAPFIDFGQGASWTVLFFHGLKEPENPIRVVIRDDRSIDLEHTQLKAK